MKLIKAQWETMQRRIASTKQYLQKGPLAWSLILLLIALFFVPYLFPGVTPHTLGPYAVLQYVIVVVAVLLRSRKGAFLAMGLLLVGSFIEGEVAYGFFWPTFDIQAFSLIYTSMVFVTFVAGHFRHVSQQLTLAQAELKKMALTDALTQLPNHRAMVDQLDKELERARRYGRPFSLLFFDVDHFKHVNDTHGHTTGDAVLRQISERASNVLRGGDTLGRFGGEEFVLLLPEADASTAQHVAERLRTVIAANPVATTDVPEGITMTISVGVGTHPQDGRLGPELLSQADEAMYVAKRLGRNQVRTATEARQTFDDPVLMALLRDGERNEATERAGKSPEQVKQASSVKMVFSLMSLIELRDHSMGEHSRAVSDVATAIAQEMRLPQQQVELIGTAGLLHDVGKVGIPDTLLQHADHFATNERAVIRRHPEVGAEILDASLSLHNLVPAVRHHHERWDGGGYPNQLKGVHIPLAARIIAVADAYDAIVRGSSYQMGRSEEEAMAELRRGAGTQFDLAVVQALLATLRHQQEQKQTLQTMVNG